MPLVMVEHRTIGLPPHVDVGDVGDDAAARAREFSRAIPAIISRFAYDAS